MKTHGFAQFCDDIRHEQDGKVTLVGVYQNDIIAPEIPSLVSKFAIVINIVSEHKELEVPICVEYAGEKIVDGESKIIFEKEALPKESKFMKANIHIILSPFNLLKEGMLSVKVRLDDEWQCIGSIYVRKANNKYASSSK